MSSLTPLGNRIIVEALAKKQRKTAAGILVGASSTGFEKTEEIHAKVVAVGPECKTVQVGNVVSFPAYGYDTVTTEADDTKDYMSVREGDLLAIIND